MIKVVLVDDENAMIDSMVMFLSFRIKDAKFTCIYNAPDAISFLEKERPQIMVLDLNLKGVSGLEVVQKKALELIPNIYTIVITGNIKEEVDDECKAAGVQKVLNKPVGLDDLKQTIQDAMKTLGEKGGAI